MDIKRMPCAESKVTQKSGNLMNVPANVYTRVVDWRTFTIPRLNGSGLPASLHDSKGVSRKH